MTGTTPDTPPGAPPSGGPRGDAGTQDAMLVMTDIVDSTRWTETLGHERWRALWQEHDRAARELLQRCCGREVEKTDGFLLLFASAAQAADFALGYHGALAGLSVPLQSRVALHQGPVTLRENDGAAQALGAHRVEVDGIAKPIVARLMALAQGGQTLLSATARAALDSQSGHLRSHGHWRLKGLAEPLEVHELCTRADDFRPPTDSTKAYRVARRGDLWQPLREVRNTLPAERDGFVGREGALGELARRFGDGARLVSLLGIGGAGKTRLALHYGRRWLGDHDGGVWFCDLASARSLEDLLQAVAQGLELPPIGTDPLAYIGQAIAGRGRCLVILDNFEQVWAHGEATVGRWLENSTEAAFLVTSREALSIVGEQVMALPPLALPDAVALFQQRAAAAGGATVPEDEAAVEPLVRLLDGLPLAIELAAARSPVLGPRELLARMDDRFRVLVVGGGRRDRQATLRATLDWSWDLLSPAERAALAQLSVFDAGFTLAAVEAVLDLSACEAAPWAVDLLQSLVRKSFVRPLHGHRFELLSSVQEYAAEHLRHDGRFPDSGTAAADAARQRHWRYFAALGARAAVADRCADLGNLVAACRRAAAQGDAAAAVGALAHAWAALRRTGPFHVALDLAVAVRAAVPLAPAQQATLDWVVGGAEMVMGHADAARQTLQTGLQNALAASDGRIEALLRCQRGEQFTTTGDSAAAAEELTRALALAQSLGDDTLKCSVLNVQGTLAHATGALDAAAAQFGAALALAEALRDDRWAGGLLGNLGVLAHEQGRLDEAQVHYRRALGLLEGSGGDRRWASNTRCNLGLLLHDQERYVDAEREFEATLATAREMAHPRLEATARCNLGLSLEAQGRAEAALGHHGQAVALAAGLGQRRSEGLFRVYQGRLLSRMGRLAEAEAVLGQAAVLLQTALDPNATALLDCARAELAVAQDNLAAAALHWNAAHQAAVSQASAPGSELSRELERVRPALSPRS